MSQIEQSTGMQEFSSIKRWIAMADSLRDGSTQRMSELQGAIVAGKIKTESQFWDYEIVRRGVEASVERVEFFKKMAEEAQQHVGELVAKIEHHVERPGKQEMWFKQVVMVGRLQGEGYKLGVGESSSKLFGPYSSWFGFETDGYVYQSFPVEKTHYVNPHRFMTDILIDKAGKLQYQGQAVQGRDQSAQENWNRLVLPVEFAIGDRQVKNMLSPDLLKPIVQTLGQAA